MYYNINYSYTSTTQESLELQYREFRTYGTMGDLFSVLHGLNSTDNIFLQPRTFLPMWF